MTKAAVFIAHYSLDNSPSLLNLLDLLSRKFTSVDLYHRSMSLLNTSCLQKDNIRSVPVQVNKLSRKYILQALRARLTAYDCCIAVDPHGFVLYQELCGGKRPAIYYSLELYMKNDHFGLYYPESVMQRERAAIASIDGFIIQSAEKERLFRQDYGLGETVPAFLLPVTYRGAANPGKSTFLNERYAIAADKKIALHLGGIADWHGCIEMALAFKELHDWVLFFQGYPDPAYQVKMEKTLKEEKLVNVIIANEQYENIEALAHVIMSCDIGIAWYKDISIGFRTAGHSSGKIPACLQYGLPLIAKKYQSTIEAIQDHGCGLCIDDFMDLHPAIKTIEDRYSYFSQAALQEFNRKYRFENYESGLMTFLQNIKKH